MNKVLKSRWTHWSVLLLPSIIAYFYDAFARAQKFAELNQHTNGEVSGFVSRAMTSYIFVPMICWLCFVLLTLYSQSYKSKMGIALLSNAVQVGFGTLALLVTLFIYALFTGMLTQ